MYKQENEPASRKLSFVFLSKHLAQLGKFNHLGHFIFSFSNFNWKRWHAKFELTQVSLPLYRSDKTLQDIVYKLVPGLFKSKNATGAASASCILSLCLFIYKFSRGLPDQLWHSQSFSSHAPLHQLCEDTDINKTLMNSLKYLQIHQSMFIHGCTVLVNCWLVFMKMLLIQWRAVWGVSCCHVVVSLTF